MLSPFFTSFQGVYLQLNEKIISAKNVLEVLEIIECNQEEIERLYQKSKEELIGLMDDSLQARRSFTEKHKEIFLERLEKVNPVYFKWTNSTKYYEERLMLSQFKDYFSQIILLLKSMEERNISKLLYIQAYELTGMSGVKSKTIDINPSLIKPIFEIINIHIEKHFHDDFFKTLKGEVTDRKIIFNGTTSTLAYAINKLFINGLISNNIEQIKDWLATNFQYTSGKDGKVYDISKPNLVKYITKNPSKSKPHIQISGIKELIEDYLNK